MEFDPVLVHDWLRRSAKRFSQKEALICGQERLTYKTIDELTDRLAHVLLDAGVKRHDRVVILLDNSCEAVISIYGILKAGASFVILDGSVKSHKLKYIINSCGPKLLITHTSKAKVVIEAISNKEDKIKIIWVGPQKEISSLVDYSFLSWETVLSGNFSISDEKLPGCIEIDLASLIYTSGSTGEPKGVMATHHNMISVARSVIEYLDNNESDIILNVLPLSFGYGLYQVIMAFMYGGTVILEKSFLYVHPLLEIIKREKVTGIPLVPTVLALLLRLEDLSKYDFSSVRYITNAGAALPKSHTLSVRKMFPHIKIFSMYGLTECKRATYLPFEELDSKPDSVGGPIPNTEVFVVDENGKLVSPGQHGELIIRGPHVMQGYWNDSELTAKTFRPGRYPGEKVLHSGDYFRIDEKGFLFFIGRKDDMIKCRGERVAARELENILSELEGIAETAVIGLPDEVLGQAIKVFVVKINGADLTEKEILKYCSINLENYMMPKYVQFIDKLPRMPNGKIDKIKLIEGDFEN